MSRPPHSEPEIIGLAAKQLVGISKTMSRIDDRTGELWGEFMPRRTEIADRTTTDYVSMQVYPRGPEQVADPAATFTKWATVEVADTTSVPAGMSSYQLQAGLYAVFKHKGPASDLSTVMYIFTEWLPNATQYRLDDREHFEVLPEGYNALNPDAEETFWIPVAVKE